MVVLFVDTDVIATEIVTFDVLVVVGCNDELDAEIVFVVKVEVVERVVVAKAIMVVKVAAGCDE